MKCFGLFFLSAVSTSFAFAPAGGRIGKTPSTTTFLLATRAIGPPRKKVAKPAKKIAVVKNDGSDTTKAAPVKKVGFSFRNGKAKPAVVNTEAAPVKKAGFSFGNRQAKSAVTKDNAVPVKKAGFSFGQSSTKSAATAAKTKNNAAPVKKAGFSFGKPPANAVATATKTKPKTPVVKKAVKTSTPANKPIVKIVSTKKPRGGPGSGLFEVKMVKLPGGELPSWYMKK